MEDENQVDEKIEMVQIKRCKLEQSNDNNTIGISTILTLGFVYVFSEFWFSSFEIVSLFTI